MSVPDVTFKQFLPRICQGLWPRPVSAVLEIRRSPAAPFPDTDTPVAEIVLHSALVRETLS